MMPVTFSFVVTALPPAPETKQGEGERVGAAAGGSAGVQADEISEEGRGGGR